MKLTTSLPKEVIETQLARILGSRQFASAPRLTRFLSFLVEESLAGRSDRLKGYTIGVEVFDRPEDFDPQTDTIVRVQARALRQKLEQYYAQEGKTDPIHIAVAKGSYEPTFFLSWDGNGPQTPNAGATAVVAGKPSIAVLPFDDFSQNEAGRSIALGLTEEAVSDLSRFRELAVFSRATMEKVKLARMSIPEIREAIGADFVLEGSLRLGADTIDITINLIDAVSDSIILTEHFQDKAETSSVYEIQDQIARRIATRIAGRYGPIEHYARDAARMGLARKWQTFSLIGRSHQRAFFLDHEDRDEIRNGLVAALGNGDESSDAHAALALIYADEYLSEFDADRLRELTGKMLESARLAVASDPRNAVALEASALANYFAGRSDEFHRDAKRALELNPGHGDLKARLAICYLMRAEWETALDLLDRAIVLDPLNAGWFHTAPAVVLAMTEGPQEALVEIRISPMDEYFFYHAYLIWILVELGGMKAAMRSKTRLLEVEPNFEKAMSAHFRLWRADLSLVDRTFAAWRKVGFRFDDHDNDAASEL